MIGDKNLSGAYELIASDKVKDRTEGLNLLKDIIDNPDSVQSMVNTGDAKVWLSMFQVLFTAISSERTAVLKRGMQNAPAVNINRLSSSAGILRSVVEKTHTHYSKKTIKAIFAHLTQMLSNSGKLFTPVALDYIKALKTIFSHRPHMDNLNQEMWTLLVRLCFDGLFSDNMKLEDYFDDVDLETIFESGGNQKKDIKDKCTHRQPTQPAPTSKSSKEKKVFNSDDSEKAEDVRMDDSSDSDTSGPAAIKKRKRRAVLSPPSQKSTAAAALKSRTTSLEQIELISLLTLLLTSSPSSSIPLNPPITTASILAKFLRFFHSYQTETSAHLDVLRSINAVIREIEFNNVLLVQRFCKKAWGLIVPFWGTKSREIKEQVFILLRQLLPFVGLNFLSLSLKDADGIREEEGKRKREDLQMLVDLLAKEGESRWGNEALSLDCLKLGKMDNDWCAKKIEQKAFCTRTFKFGPHFTSSQAMTWASLELYADCVGLILSSLSSSEPLAFTLSLHQSKKRRRLESPLTTVLDSIQSSFTTDTNRVYDIQVLLFIIDRHWKLLSNVDCGQVKAALTELLSNEDSDVQSWALITLGCIVEMEKSTPVPESSSYNKTVTESQVQETSPSALFPPSRETVTTTRWSQTHHPQLPNNSHSADWLQVWHFATRRLVVPSVCRAASHILVLLIESEQIFRSKVLTDLESIFKDIEVQGPTFPYDSVCMFMCSALNVVSNDVRLLPMELEDHVLAWLTNNWNVVAGTTKVFGVRSRVENHSIADMLDLFSTLCRLSRRTRVLVQCGLPHSPLVDFLIEHLKTKRIRMFVLESSLDVPSSQAPTDSSVSFTPSPLVPNGLRDQLVPLTDTRARKIITFLAKSLDLLDAEWRTKDALTNTTKEKVRRTVDLGVLTMFFAATLKLNGTYCGGEILRKACELLRLVLPTFKLPRFSPLDLSLILEGLAPMVRQNGGGEEEFWPGLLEAGPFSGLEFTSADGDGSQNVKRNKGRAVDAERRSLQWALFESEEVKEVVAEIHFTLESLLKAFFETRGRSLDELRSGSGDMRDDDDDFGSIRIARNDILSGDSGVSAQKAFHSFASLAILFNTVSQQLEKKSSDPARQHFLVDALCSGDGEEFLLLGPSIINAFKLGHLHLQTNDASNIIEIVQDFVDSYTYGRNEDIFGLVVQFLDASLELWSNGPTAETVFAQDARLIAKWFCENVVKGALRSWRTRIQLSVLLDHYLEEDDSGEVWDLGIEEDDLKENEHPRALIPAFLQDVDLRVRFRATTSACNLYNTFSIHTPQKIARLLNSNLEDSVVPEMRLTHILCYGNEFIASARTRSRAYFSLLDLATTSLSADPSVKESGYQQYIRNVLLGAVSRLHLPSLSSIYRIYLPTYILDLVESNPGDVGSLSAPALGITGYPDSKAYATDVILHAGDVLVQQKYDEYFEALCNLSGLDPSVCRQRCLAGSIALLFDQNVPETVDEDDSHFEQLIQSLEQMFQKSGNAEKWKDAFQPLFGDVIVKSFSHLKDVHEVVNQLQSTGHTKEAIEFQKLVPNPPSSDSTDVFDSVSVQLPRATAEAILWTYRRLIELASKEYAEEIARSVVLNGLFSLACAAGLSPLVNEQKRYVYAMAFFTAIYQKHFTSSTVLMALLQVASVLMLKSSVRFLVQDFVIWALDRYLLNKKASNGFVDLFVGFAYLEIKMASKDSSSFLSKLELKLLSLLQTDNLKAQGKQILLLWPRPLRGRLEQEEIILSDSGSLSQIILDHTLKVPILPVMNKLQLSIQEQGTTEMAVSDMFWRLKSTFHRRGQTDNNANEYAAALNDLLYAGKGHLHAPKLDSIKSFKTSASDSFTEEQSKDGRRTVAPYVFAHRSSTKFVVVVMLLDALSDPDINLVSHSFETLKLLSNFWPALVVETGSLGQQLPFGTFEMMTLISPSIKKPLHQSSVPFGDMLFRKDILCPLDGTYPRWITGLAMSLIDLLGQHDQFYSQLRAVVQSSPSISRRLLPHLVHSLLDAASDDLMEVEEPRSRRGQDKPRSQMSRLFSTVLEDENIDQECRRTVLDVVLHLRHFHPTNSLHPTAYEGWLNLDNIVLARNAAKCHAYTTALYFLEHHHYTNKSSVLEDENAEKNSILYDIYNNIDDPDGFYGIQDADIGTALVQRFHHENQWQRSFELHGAQFEAGDRSSSSASVAGIISSLNSFGFDKIAMTFLQGSRSRTFTDEDEDVTNQLGFDLAWRTDDWDIPFSTDAMNQTPAESLYGVLRAAHRERDLDALRSVLTRAFTTLLSKLDQLSMESISNVREISRTLLSLREVQNWLNPEVQQLVTSSNLDARTPWDWFEVIPQDFEFDTAEQILAVRRSLLRSLKQRDQLQSLDPHHRSRVAAICEVEKKCHLKLCSMARSEGRSQTALNAVKFAQMLESEPSIDTSQALANVLWLQGEHNLAIKQLASVYSSALANSEDEYSRAILLAQLGDWNGTARLERPEDIRDKYFKAALASAGGGDKNLDPKIFYQYANFSEQQYKAISSNPEVDRLRLYQSRNKRDIEDISVRLKSIRSEKRKSGGSKGSNEASLLASQLSRKNKLLEEDASSLKEYEDAKEQALKVSMEMFSKCLIYSGDFDDSLLRLASLWIKHKSDDALNKYIGRFINQIPTHKFIFLINQLCAIVHLPSTVEGASSPFQHTLQNLLYRMCRDHPFHTLHQVYALKQSSFPPKGNLSSSFRRQLSNISSAAEGMSQVGRAAAATAIFEKLLTLKDHTTRLKQFETFFLAALEWTEYDLKQVPGLYDASGKRNKRAYRNLETPSALRITKLQNLDIAVSTANITIDLTCKYLNVPKIKSYQPKFDIATGLSTPKVVACRDYDGKRWKQIFKCTPKDDPRQDAVMEQVFGLVNMLLGKDRKTRSRSLKIRDYKVIALSRQSAIIEFVNNAQALYDWLPTAHKLYYPDELLHENARAEMASWRPGKGKDSSGDQVSRKQLGKQFIKMMSNIHPVMHFFFIEKHRQPISWFSMRLNYSRSVATNSIVGWMLGLGDRHLNNIMIDVVQGEIINIDLGIAFDQGRNLGIPELVPFRLTADMVDGLGMTGTEGVFRRCSEETLRVLREQIDTIRTVMEVLRYDPLQQWVPTVEKINQVQGLSSSQQQAVQALSQGGEFNIHSGDDEEEADRALSGILKKLDASLSVEYKVNELITTARDPENLGSLFPGWSPWC